MKIRTLVNTSKKEIAAAMAIGIMIGALAPATPIMACICAALFAVVIIFA